MVVLSENNQSFDSVKVIEEGMDYVDKIKRGSSSSNGSVNEPDHMIKVTVGKKSQPEESSKE